VLLKECSPKVSVKHFKGLDSGFTELYAKPDVDSCSILPFIADKVKHEVDKALV
jgi:hypothetical protein